MQRRDFLKALAIPGSAGLAPRAQAPGQPAPRAGAAQPMLAVGPLDLGRLEVVDAHVHPPEPMTLSDSYGRWNFSFVDAMLPDYDYPGKADLRARLEKEFVQLIYDLPRQTGYNNYIARVYGVKPTIEDFDAVLARGIKSGFTPYVRSILDREKIVRLVLQSRELEPVRPTTYVPGDRFVWTYAFAPLIQPDWAQKQGIRTLDAMLAELDRILRTAVANGCAGFKNGVAYYRPLGIEPVGQEQASAAMQALLAATPAGHTQGYAPYYGDPSLNTANRTYQDYLLKHIFVRAGELKRPIIIHTAVGLHPALRLEFNDPHPLYGVFQDNEIKKAETQFVLIHTGYPNHHVVAAMLSQFPNVFADVSFWAKFPGTLEETLRAFLSLAPPTKVMHGSDSNNVPEEIGYCATNTRRVLARILNDFRTYYGWTDADCARIARGVLSENAKRVFGITT